MLSRCVRSVLFKTQAFNAANKSFSTRTLDSKNIVILQYSNQNHGRFTKAPERSFAKFVSAVEIQRSRDKENFRLSEKMTMELKKRGITRILPYRNILLDDDVMRSMVYNGFDVIVQTRIGIEKTETYIRPLVDRLISEGETLLKDPRMLIVTPTSELADVVEGVIKSDTKILKVVCVKEKTGTSNQEIQLRRRADVVIGTPRAIIDLIEKGTLNISKVNHVVIDELDAILNMGCTDDMDKILRNRYRTDKKDENPQTLFFTTTVPSWVRNTTKNYLGSDIEVVDLDGMKKNPTLESIEDFNFEKNIFEENMKDLKTSLENVTEFNKKKFDKFAKYIIKDSDPIDLLARTLAVAAGYKQKSLIDFEPGFVTLKLTSDIKVDNMVKASEMLPEMLLSRVRNIRICCDEKSFVFDVPMMLCKKYMESMEQGHDNNISVIEALPPLIYTPV